VVLRGDQGVGKGCLCSEFGKIFGSHFIHVTSPQHFVGRFNQHMKDCLVLFADEAFWAGEKSAEGFIKGLITEDTLWIEQKGKDAFPI
jgi:hypothetical protein